MKYFWIIALLATFGLLNSSCKKDPCCTPDPSPSLNQLDFTQLAVGQKSKYLTLYGEQYFDAQAATFYYLDDTLTLEVIAQDPSKGFEVEERLRYQGDLSPTWLEYDRDSVYRYYLRVSNDSLVITPKTGNYVNSRIFRVDFTNPKLPLNPIQNPETKINTWITELPYCECNRNAYVKNYTQFGRIYPRLNIAVRNASMAMDGPGSTFVYAASDGIVRFSHYIWWTQTGYGFDLLP